jgi:hypothetical protein
MAILLLGVFWLGMKESNERFVLVIDENQGVLGELQDSDLESLRPKSWHWIKSNINVELLKSRFRRLDYSMSKDTVRQDSIGQQEVIHLYKQLF